MASTFELRPIDISALKDKLTEATESVAKDDPKALRARIKELETKQHPTLVHKAALDETLTLMYRTSEEQAATVYEVIGTVMDIEEICRKLHTALDTLKSSLQHKPDLKDLLRAMPEGEPAVSPKPKDKHQALPTADASPRSENTTASVPNISGLGKGELAVLCAIAQKKGGATRAFLVLATDLRKASVESYVQRLVSAGLVSRGESKKLFATAHGFSKLPPGVTQLPTGAQLVEHYRKTLSAGEGSVFGAIAKAHPRVLSRDDLIRASKLAAASVESYLQRLVTRGLVERVPNKKVRLHPEFDQ